LGGEPTGIIRVHNWGLIEDKEQLIWRDGSSSPWRIRGEVKKGGAIATNLLTKLSHKRCTLYFITWEENGSRKEVRNQTNIDQCPGLGRILTIATRQISWEDRTKIERPQEMGRNSGCQKTCDGGGEGERCRR